jgi:gamma-glutamyltranspeptidase/glutathione hydrolase
MKALLALFLLSACSHQSRVNTPGPTSLLVVQQKDAPNASASGTKIAIAAQGKETADAGARIIKEGGNIIDAAVAVSFAIAVERPQSTGLGGGGFLLYREASSGKVYAVDFRERAPLAARRDMFLDNAGAFVPARSLTGMLSVATPGLVAGLVEIQEKWGKLKLAQVMQPAIEVAENGFPIAPSLALAIDNRRYALQRDGDASRIFFHADGSPLKSGEKLVQKDLGKTLRLIAKNGRAGFYSGPVARAILKTSHRLEGIVEKKDLTAYKVKWREPLHGTFRGLDLYSMPPPSSGGIHVLQILNILENDPLKEMGFFSPAAIQLEAGAMQLAYADRAVYPGDPDFVKVPTDLLISKEYAAQRRALIVSGKATPSSEVQAGVQGKKESPETTHFSLMDAAGNAVSSTQTVNYLFGSGVIAEGTGILLNDEMDDFSAKPGSANVYGALGGDANSVAPGKTPLSSMSPTIVVKGNTPVMAVGSPGGTRIITCVAQTILNYFAFGLPAYDAVASARLHHQWMPDRLDLESPGPGDQGLNELKKMGFETNLNVGVVPCRVEMVVREGDKLTGIADPRDAGKSWAE